MAIVCVTIPKISSVLNFSKRSQQLPHCTQINHKLTTYNYAHSVICAITPTNYYCGRNYMHQTHAENEEFSINAF